MRHCVKKATDQGRICSILPSPKMCTMRSTGLCGPICPTNTFSKGTEYGRRVTFPNPVRPHRKLPLHLPTTLDGAGSDASHNQHHLRAYKGSEVAATILLLGEGIWPHLRRGRGDRDRAGVRIRHELGRLFALCGECLR